MIAAFFVGKNELLSWLNELLQLNYTKVEQCANGAAYCQIMDAVYPVFICDFDLSLVLCDH
jgi:microtubule-associated protein, RP/EB family